MTPEQLAFNLVFRFRQLESIYKNIRYPKLKHKVSYNPYLGIVMTIDERKKGK